MEDWDAEDYAEEFEELVRAGMSSEVIVRRSDPSQAWYVSCVLPLISVSRCAKCDTLYDPLKSDDLFRCKNCKAGTGRAGFDYTPGRRIRVGWHQLPNHPIEIE